MVGALVFLALILAIAGIVTALALGLPKELRIWWRVSPFTAHGRELRRILREPITAENFLEAKRPGEDDE